MAIDPEVDREAVVALNAPNGFVTGVGGGAEDDPKSGLARIPVGVVDFWGAPKAPKGFEIVLVPLPGGLRNPGISLVSEAKAPNVGRSKLAPNGVPKEGTVVPKPKAVGNATFVSGSEGFGPKALDVVPNVKPVF